MPDGDQDAVQRASEWTFEERNERRARNNGTQCPAPSHPDATSLPTTPSLSTSPTSPSCVTALTSTRPVFEREARVVARPRFRDPPPTPAPEPPPPTRWICLRRRLARLPPFSWFTLLDWKSNSELEAGLLAVLTSSDENAVRHYRAVAVRSFWNRLVVEAVLSAVCIFVIVRLWNSENYIILMWLVLIFCAIVINQYMMNRRIIKILDHREHHSAYVREMSARLEGGGLYGDSGEHGTERRYSDDPLYLPDPPPVYSTAAAVPPAYNSPPTAPKPTEFEMAQIPRPAPTAAVSRRQPVPAAVSPVLGTATAQCECHSSRAGAESARQQGVLESPETERRPYLDEAGTERKLPVAAATATTGSERPPSPPSSLFSPSSVSRSPPSSAFTLTSHTLPR